MTIKTQTQNALCSNQRMSVTVGSLFTTGTVQDGPKNRAVFWKFETPVYVDIELRSTLSQKTSPFLLLRKLG